MLYLFKHLLSGETVAHEAEIIEWLVCGRPGDRGKLCFYSPTAPSGCLYRSRLRDRSARCACLCFMMNPAKCLTGSCAGVSPATIRQAQFQITQCFAALQMYTGLDQDDIAARFHSGSCSRSGVVYPSILGSFFLSSTQETDEHWVNVGRTAGRINRLKRVCWHPPTLC
jgi:hypothetical protein